jgi:hypothetical protein
MNMIVTLKSIEDGFFRCKIKRVIGEPYYKEFTAEALQDYLTAADFYCEVNSYRLIFIVPDAIKKMCGEWLATLEKQHNNNSDDA